MTVIANKSTRTAHLACMMGHHTGLYGTDPALPKNIRVYSGVMPTEVSMDPNLSTNFDDLLAIHAPNLLVEWVLEGLGDRLDTTWNTLKKGWEATTIPNARNGIISGTATWFIAEPTEINSRYGNGHEFAFFLSDSIAAVGSNAILTLDSLSITAGSPVSIIDFSLGAK